MPNFLRPRLLLDRLLSIRAAFFLSAIITWPVLAELELFEAFYAFSRAHENWEIDELALLFVNLTIALVASTLYQSHRLKKLSREREFEHQRAENNARHDPLTGLMNRRAFSAVLEKSTAHASGAGEHFIAMIDLDRFKPINDLHGHAAGDATLRGVAERLEEAVSADGVVARLGGDEFAVIFSPSTDAKQAERISRRVLQAMEQAFEFRGTRMFISCSIGLVSWGTGVSGSEALGRADRALYAAKSQGRGRFTWYDAELDRQSTARAEIEADLRAAIQKGDIEPWFQPIVHIESSELIGFEVLARWEHPRHGQIPPEVFVEIAEDCGQIGALGLSLLRQACRSASAWDPDLSISFNLSAHQFHDPKLVENVRDTLNLFDFDPKRLTIEITESAVIQDFSAARVKLEALKSFGIKVALDDFGTGYSSLASLRQLPFDRIKIDRSFVTNISALPQNQKIVSGIMSLAKGLDLDVTAEGIETDADLTYLQSLQCSLGQGFHFEKAVPGAQVTWLLETEWSDGGVKPITDRFHGPERPGETG